jgi:hypothetical protein
LGGWWSFVGVQFFRELNFDFKKHGYGCNN